MMLKWYKGAALLFFNSLVIFLMLNLISLPILKLINKSGDDSQKIYSPANFKKVYPGYSESEIDALLEETHDRGFIYDPYQGYREAPYRGRYVNVSEHGYRYNFAGQPDVNDSTLIPIFIFGGSTTFGYGVSDSMTVAAYLDRAVSHKNTAYRVYNFGAGGYFSPQEMIWFKRTLTQFRKPAIAVFLDGLNEFKIQGEDPLFAGDIRKLLGTMKLSEDISDSKAGLGLLFKLPVFQLWYRSTEQKKITRSPIQTMATSEKTKQLIKRYKTNCLIDHLLANAFGVKTLFVIQPVPQYDYDLGYHIFGADPDLKDPLINDGYAMLKNSLSDSSLTWLWLADMQHDAKQNFYVDNVHYNPLMNQMIAEKIFMALDSIIPAQHER